MATPIGYSVLTSQGQTDTIVVSGIDQNFQSFSPVPAAVYSVSDSSIASVDSSGTVTAVANGISKVMASLLTNEGLFLEVVGSVVVAMSPPVMTGISLDFASSLAQNQPLGPSSGPSLVVYDGGNASNPQNFQTLAINLGGA